MILELGTVGPVDGLRRIQQESTKHNNNNSPTTSTLSHPDIGSLYDYIYSYSPSSVSNTTSNNNNNNNKNNNLVEQVRHIIHFEHLTREFASLMDAYQLPVNLTTVNQQLSRSDWNTEQTVADLDSQTRRLIEDVYELDFELSGGYIMIERTKLARNDPTNLHVCSDGQLLYVVGSKMICL
ncbi:hypothetical protein IV203_027226 [Nitzschia inconspicua]|uniref:Uncharacterized protein n=1 Tax=Nitzschia inconspicua TaxID=303405 RepID=A0A9K3LXB0_9STRA|nr:hypothetical protein IV203_027226 [Nitzschia inconspicua]